jgi:farnesyl-diphosphate farnesyltransferase
MSASSPPAAADLRYCREVLPRVSRTFAINIRLLGPAMRDAVCVGYLLCRAADALEDSWPGPSAEIRERFDRFRSAVAGDARAGEELAERVPRADGTRADLELLRNLPRVLSVHAALPPLERAAVARCLDVMSAGMCRYSTRAAARGAEVPYVDDEAELHDYCYVVAGCVGEMLTRLFNGVSGDPDRAERRLELAPVVGEALQLTNVLLDWPHDVAAGRCFLPASWLREEGLSVPDLLRVGEPRLRSLAARLEALARAALARVPDYVDLVPARHVRYRLFCLWPALWALGSIRHARRDPRFPAIPERPKLPRAELWGAALASALVSHHRGAMRRLYAAAS